MAKAIKKIKKGVQLDPHDADNWIVWGLIMRTVGNYKSALHKFREALKLDPENAAAKYELHMLYRIIQLDGEISLDEISNFKKFRPVYDDQGLPLGNKNVIDITQDIKFKNSEKPDCGEIEERFCNIF